MTLTEFRALAERATPGPWAAWESLYVGMKAAIVQPDDDPLRTIAEVRTNWGDAAWIAAASPTAILALIERLERAETALRPFADYADDGPKSDPEIVYSMLDDDELVGHGIPIGHYRRAAAYFDAPAGEGEG